MDHLSDNALMSEVKSGDLDKLGLLYERHKKTLFGFFYNLGNNPSVSEDLVQNVFMRMLKYRGSYTGKGMFGAWMFRMARNVNYDHHKKTAKEKISWQVSSEELGEASDDGFNESMEREGNSILLKRALAKLSDEKRELLILSKYKGLKFGELAEILGCTEGAAKVRVHRALKELRTIFLELETS
ncbi:sigma-70 family RNA polymerase sigma factor [Muricauda sp. JGD-17]|uniref:Sigma-70 family RNA polymerase sigma factor n=1 Tax=Flagellimonas ochracea TaxID=2696472 RepID=A0A964WYB9_9FLAO|nr:sigma-70 family RNA polymerase sigma factor [Allomuricauda ochracea]